MPSFPSSNTKDGNQETLLQAINSLVDYAYIECDRNSRVLVETDFEIIRSTLAEIEDKLKHAKSSKNNNDFTPSPNSPSTSIQQESNDKTRTKNFQDVDKDEKEIQQPKSKSVNDKIVLTKKRRKLSFPLLSPMVSVEEDEVGSANKMILCFCNYSIFIRIEIFFQNRSLKSCRVQEEGVSILFHLQEGSHLLFIQVPRV